MLLAFELSGEHETLPKAEIAGCLRALKIPYTEETDSAGILVINADIPTAACNILSTRLGMTHGMHEIIGVCKPEEREILKLIRTTDMTEFMGPGQTFAVRVRGKKPASLERGLEGRAGGALKRRGYEVNLTNPSKTFTLLFTKQTCLFCLLLHSRDKKLFEVRRPHLRPFFSPGVIMPKFARALVNLSGVKAKDVLLDPFCGTGGILIEAGMMDVSLIGIDVQKKMVRGATRNLEFYHLNSDLIVGDASKIALRDNSVDTVVTDLPYGRSSLVSSSFADSSALFPERLYLNALDELHRVLKSRGRMVIVFSSQSLQTLFHRCNFRVLEKHKYRVHKSLDRYITVLEKER